MPGFLKLWPPFTNSILNRTWTEVVRSSGGRSEMPHCLMYSSASNFLSQDVTETDTKTPKAMSTHTRSSTRDDLRNITIEDDNEKNKNNK